jgi:hypothetical protein
MSNWDHIKFKAKLRGYIVGPPIYPIINGHCSSPFVNYLIWLIEYGMKIIQLILSVKMDHHKIGANLFSRISEIMGTKLGLFFMMSKFQHNIFF